MFDKDDSRRRRPLLSDSVRSRSDMGGRAVSDAPADGDGGDAEKRRDGADRDIRRLGQQIKIQHGCIDAGCLRVAHCYLTQQLFAG